MTTFIALPDIHDRRDNIKKIANAIADVDVVLLAGDMTNGRLTSLQALVNEIRQYNQTIYSVCGNMDNVTLDDWLNQQKIGIHRKHVIVDDLAILGCGGALPFYGKYVFSEDELAQFLDDANRNIPADMAKVLVCHQPPYGVLDSPSRDSSKHAGSQAVRAFIERVQPLICFTGHMHSSVGIERIGKTQVINPGPIWQSKQYAYADIQDGKVITLDIRDI